MHDYVIIHLSVFARPFGHAGLISGFEINLIHSARGFNETRAGEGQCRHGDMQKVIPGWLSNGTHLASRPSSITYSI